MVAMPESGGGTPDTTSLEPKVWKAEFETMLRVRVGDSDAEAERVQGWGNRVSFEVLVAAERCRRRCNNLSGLGISGFGMGLAPVSEAVLRGADDTGQRVYWSAVCAQERAGE